MKSGVVAWCQILDGGKCLMGWCAAVWEDKYDPGVVAVVIMATITADTTLFCMNNFYNEF
jgi:hypothetical protein